MKENIRVIHEETKTEIEEMKSVIKNAKRIFFLGFGYAKENMEVLNIPRILRTQEIYGTALGLTQKEIYTIYQSFWKNPAYKDVTPALASATNIKIENLDCVSLLKKYL